MNASNIQKSDFILGLSCAFDIVPDFACSCFPLRFLLVLSHKSVIEFDASSFSMAFRLININMVQNISWVGLTSIVEGCLS